METKFSVILPIKDTLSKDFSDLFSKSIESINNQRSKVDELVIVYVKNEKTEEFLNEFDFGDLNKKTVEFLGEPNFSEQINLGVSSSSNDWVSYIEFDDEYSPIWFGCVNKYISYYPEVDVFLPIVIDVDTKNAFAGFTNEATFANNFSQEIGYLTNDTLHQYQNFQTAGMVFKKSVFEDFGGFKPSIELTFVYELLLRITYNSAKIMTIPKIGYKHLNLREESIFWDYKFGSKKLSENEVKFWINTAKKEYFFTDDRNIKYLENV
jgi:hypothetical protein